jgi:hypothetical protein
VIPHKRPLFGSATFVSLVDFSLVPAKALAIVAARKSLRVKAAASQIPATHRRKPLIMLADPTDGFLAGITSGPARLLIGAAAILLGFGVCVLPLPWRSEAFLAIAVLAFASIFQWASYGAWFFLGLAALVASFAFLHAFVMDRAPSLSLFATFTCAALYLAPITFSGTRTWSIALYCAAALSYWIVPSAIGRCGSGNGR